MYSFLNYIKFIKDIDLNTTGNGSLAFLDKCDKFLIEMLNLFYQFFERSSPSF